MSHRFSRTRPTVGATLPRDTYGRLVGEFRSASHIPLRGGRDSGRHIYLNVNVSEGRDAGIFECAVNIRSDEGTEVLYCERIEDLDSGAAPADGFEQGVRVSYGTGPDGDGVDYMGLADSDFQTIVNDELYNRIADLSQGCDRIAAYGTTYSDGTGIHDIHMKSGTQPGDPQARDDRDHKDGAIAFYFNLEAAGDKKSYATWVFIKFASQSVVNYS
jgi:uncharacterized protein YukJ